MPDAFESAHGLNSLSAADRNLTMLSPLGYTNLEVYLDMAAAGLFAFVPLAGDYNDDGTVDAADDAVWRDALISGATLLNETASLGTVDSDDYDTWKANFGAIDGNGGQSIGVPEPMAWFLALSAVLGIAAGRRLRQMSC